MALVYLLFEHSTGYALFAVQKFEVTGSVLDLTDDIKRFTKYVKLVAFSPFSNATEALENINSLTEGVLPKKLYLFLKKYLPKVIVLGLSDVKIAPEISEAFNVKCEVSGGVPELIRGVRMHFYRLVEGITSKDEGFARLSLGRAYSRAKIKFNVHKTDNMIIQGICLLDQLDKDINTFSMRLREWYSYHFPELYKIVSDNYTFTKVVQYVKNRKDLDESKLQGLAEILSSSEKAQSILNAARYSMGFDIQPIDLIAVQSLTTRLISLVDFRTSLALYTDGKMHDIAPNLTQLVGDQVGARLIAHAGSLTNLAKYPASTVQVLGAEKALFRALRTGSNTPKYGLLFHSSIVGRAKAKDKGRISRNLANKCSIASRIDCFSQFSSSVFGQKLRQQMEDRLVFYETGKKPKKNQAIMEEAEAEMIKERKCAEKKKRKQDKKKKRLLEQNECTGEDVLVEYADINNTDVPKKKKKKKKSVSNVMSS